MLHLLTHQLPLSVQNMQSATHLLRVFWGQNQKVIIYIYIYIYKYVFKEATPHSAGPGQGFFGLRRCCWDVLGTTFGSTLFGVYGGLGGSEATGKGFSRIGSGVAGDPDLGPTWFQLGASWKPLGATMGST